jgi:osmoprotectant transport system ATP-binding protein
MIELKKVTKVYPNKTKAVDNVSFEVQKGEFCVLLGPSGCGKSTVIKMINRMIPLTSGKILIDGTDNADINQNELRRNIGYVIQDIGLFPHMTVRENIETVPKLKGWPKDRCKKKAQELLELLRMDPNVFMDKYPHELSGGQQQRVGVARALGGDPPILLMDEPFGAIDPITREKLQNEFLKIQQDLQKTIIFVTHDIYEAIKMADKIALMKQNKLVQYGTPADLLYRPKDDFVADFVGADRGIKGLQLVRIEEIMWKSPPTIRLEDGLEVAEQRMDEKRIQWLPVIDDKGKFLGWVTRSDLKKGQTLKGVINVSGITVLKNVVLSDALSMMLTSGRNALPVVDKYNKLEGVITFQLIRKTLSEAAQKEKINETSGDFC